MNRRSTLLSGMLLAVLVSVSFLFDGGVARGLTSNSDVELEITNATHLLGQEVVFSGTLALAADETVSLNGVTLANTTGPQALDVSLPVQDTSGEFVDFSNLTSAESDSLMIKVTLDGVSRTGGTLSGTLGSTLGGTLAGTLPSTLPTVNWYGSGSLLASGSGGTIEYEVKWSPGVALDPLPSLTLLPAYDVYYDIPTLTPPNQVSGTTLPGTESAWTVPVAGETEGTALPSADLAFAVPQITLSTNAPSYAPDLPDTTATSTLGFAIPTLSVATSSAASFSDDELSDMFTIATVPVDSAPSGVGEWGASAESLFIVPDPSDGATTTAQTIKGMTHDGTDFWFVVGGASNDSLLRVDGTTYAKTSATTLPSTSFTGVAYVGSSLLVLEQKHRCWDTIESTIPAAVNNDTACNYNSRIFKVDPADLPESGSATDWVMNDTTDNGDFGGATSTIDTIYRVGEEWDEYTGIAAGDSGTFWVIDKHGNTFRNIKANGQQKKAKDGEWTSAEALAFNKKLLYTAEGSTITQWTDSGSKITDWDTGVDELYSLSIVSDVVYFASNDNGQVYASFIGESVSQDSPRGVAYSAAGAETALWVLLDGSPKDKVLKVDSTTGALITNFSTDGIADAPSDKTEGIVYYDSYVWIVANESSGCCDDQRTLYQINATTGNTEETINLNDIAWNDIGGITHNGTNFVVWAKTWNDVWKFNVSGSTAENVGQSWPYLNGQDGVKGLSYHSGRDEYFATAGDKVFILDSQFNSVGSDSGTSLELCSGSTSGCADHADSTAFASAQGAVFSGDNLFIVSGTEVYQSFLAAEVTTKPLGITWSPSTATGLGGNESLWVLVDAAPYDKILRIHTSDNTLDTSFDTDGIADAPSKDTEGLAFIADGSNNYLYIVANDGGGGCCDQGNKNLYIYNIGTKEVEETINLGDAEVHEDVGGIAYDGVNFRIVAKSGQGVWTVAVDADSGSAQKVSSGWPWSSLWGMTATAYHETRGVMYGAGDSTLVIVSDNPGDPWSPFMINNEDTFALTQDDSSVSGIQGMTFGQDLLYVARYESSQGYVSSGALTESVTTKPQGLAFSDSDASYQGQSIGEALWVVVDGSPKDRVLKIDAGTEELDTDFGSDETTNGSAALPTNTITGVAFIDDALYVMDKENNTLYKLAPTTGAVSNTYSLCGMGHGGGGGSEICDQVGGIGQGAFGGGDDQMLVGSRNNDGIWFVNSSGSVEDNRHICCSNMGSGSDAIGYVELDNTYWTASGSKVQMWINPWGNDIFPAGNPHTVTGLQNIKGIGIKQTAKQIYMAWNDGDDGFISVAVPPSPISNTPLDLAYNEDDGEMYILVDGDGGDVVVAVDPASGEILEDAAGNQRFGTVNSEDAYAIAYHDGEVVVAYEERGDFMGGPPPVVASRRDKETLEEISLTNINSTCGKIMGLESDGESLIATVEWCGPKVETINLDGGFVLREIYFWTNEGHWMEEGFEDVGYSEETPSYFVLKNGDVYRIDEGGQRIDSWSITDPSGDPINKLVGVEFVTNELGTEEMYLADMQAGKVYKTQVPMPETTYTNKPKGITSDGASNIWVAVDAEPVDKIIKMSASTSSASVITSFDAPGTEVSGLAMHGGSLWVLSNDTHNIEICDEWGCHVDQIEVPTVAQINPSTGAEIAFSPLIVDNNYGGEDILKEKLGGLGSDGTKLYTGSIGEMGGNGALYTIDTNNIRNLCMFGKCFSAPLASRGDQKPGSLQNVNSIQAVAVAPGASFDDDRRLIVAGGDFHGDYASRLSRLDIEALNSYKPGPGGVLNDSAMLDQYDLPGGASGLVDVRGIEIVGTVMYMVDYENGKLLGTALPENTGVEMTVVGSYEAALTAVTGSGTLTSGALSYGIERNPDVKLQLTTPGNNFVATSTTATIAGRVNDPSITSVSVGIQLPSTEFLDDQVDTSGSSASQWAVATTHGDGSVAWAIDSTGQCPSCASVEAGAAAAWRFGKPGGSSFDQPNSRVAGTLTSNENFPVNEGTVLSFKTAWDTEFQPEMDQKFVQVATVTQDFQGNDVTGNFQSIAQVVQFVDPMMMWMPDNAHPNMFQWVQKPPLPFSPGEQHQVNIDLSPLQGQNVKIRFAFDSQDEFANEGAGWYVDNITFAGSGEKTISIPTTKLDPPVVAMVDGQSTTLHREFSTLFTLSEGVNTVKAKATQPYSPNKKTQTTAVGFVDTIDPVITLHNVPAHTNQASQTLKGTLVEPTITQGGMMEIRHVVEDAGGETSSALIGKVTAEGEFSVFVSLQEGTNRFVATARDGGGREATRSLVSVADFTAPELVGVRAVGVASEDEALVGDQYFVVVAATDSISGVDTSVLVKSSGDVSMPAVDDVPEILVSMHGLKKVLVRNDDGEEVPTNATHILLDAVQSGTPVGLNDLTVRVTDKAGNSRDITGYLDVVSSRSNRNYFLFPGNNFMGLALIPDDDDDSTSATCGSAGCEGTEDSSMDRLMEQDISKRVSNDFKTAMGTTTITLGNVVESTFAFDKRGDFINHVPGGGSQDTLEEMKPFQGMNVFTDEDAYQMVEVAGFTAHQAVPIRINIEGVFFRQGQLPPGLEMRVGYNLIAPHILGDTKFDTVYRGALVPRALAVSALSFDRRVDASLEDDGSISAQISEGFVTNSIGDLLKPELSYWTFIASDPLDTRVNDLDEALGPTITP